MTTINPASVAEGVRFAVGCSAEVCSDVLKLVTDPALAYDHDPLSLQETQCRDSWIAGFVGALPIMEGTRKALDDVLNEAGWQEAAKGVLYGFADGIDLPLAAEPQLEDTDICGRNLFAWWLARQLRDWESHLTDLIAELQSDLLKAA